MLTLLIDHPACRSLTVTIQKEVAQRIGAAPGCREYGAISVITQRLCEIERVATLPAACFWPRPKVESAMLHLERRTPPPPEPPRALASACARLFQSRRKQIRSALGPLLDRPELADLDPAARAEDLSPAQIARIASLLESA
jgi:16S rRNA (adenine1518-N6/adenine1519-N6)-dimethyltransferase